MPSLEGIFHQLRRIGWILGSTIGVIVSLLTFPNALPWMIACWFLCHIVLVLGGRPGWIPLVVTAAIVLVKNVDWPPALLILAAVTLAIGFLRKRPRAATKANLQQIIDASRAAGAEVVLMEIPRGFIFDPYGGLERELARENNLELVPDSAIRNLVLWSPFAPPGMCFDPDHHLSDDGLHPNANGNRFLAECVTDALVRLYGSKVRAR